jgi:hypothetical protein
MACYDIDRFREFVKSEGFNATFDIDEATRNALYTDDMALLKFGEQMILQIMFGEESIKRKSDAYDALVTRRQEQGKLREELDDEGPDSDD